MKKYTLCFIVFALCFCSLAAQDEYRIQFSYDAAGNQVLRDRVCINCNSGKSEIDSTAVAALDEKLEELGLDEENLSSSSITAYPNPVTNVLQVEWLGNENIVKSVLLFSGIGRKLQSKNISPKATSMGLNFSGYPPGSYFVIVQYADKTKESFQVIKK
ncbi:T9SS type A sorting domain-containing protein [Maribacter sp. 2307UL18-2]|uniref:T9SS type A sorting domain-containing protein n=1 Tax=Maribacter sp. 2307UL18-2 TaxID=3386274 RepID=UPI0039BCBAEC